MLFENERQAGIKCTNTYCAFCMEELDIVCDSIDSDGDPSYANCYNYLPEKLLENIELEKQQLTNNKQSGPCDHHRCSPGNYGLENYCDHPDAWEW